MTLLPRLLGSDYWDAFPDFPEHLFDQHFGGGIHDSDLINAGYGGRQGLVPTYWIFPRSASVPRGQRQQQPPAAAVKNGPVRREMQQRALASGASQVANNPQEFQVKLDVRHFKPEEVEVTVQDHNLIIHGKHEERSDEHGFISRQFTRRYALPDNVIQDKLSSSLEQNGILSVKAPKVQPEVKAGEVRSIPIQFVPSGGPAIGSAEGGQQNGTAEGGDAPMNGSAN